MPGVDLLNLRFCRCDAGSLADRARRSGGEERDSAREGRERARARGEERREANVVVGRRDPLLFVRNRCGVSAGIWIAEVVELEVWKIKK
jgi:hypothetical protein